MTPGDKARRLRDHASKVGPAATFCQSCSVPGDLLEGSVEWVADFPLLNLKFGCHCGKRWRVLDVEYTKEDESVAA